MVSEFAPPDRSDQGWVLRPTRSMSWAQARRFIALVTVVCFSVGGLFAYYGFPLVMPFSGLEALAVGVAFYLVLRDGERKEIVRLDERHLVVETGTRQRERRFEFDRFWVRVDLRRSRYRHHPTRLFVASHGRAVELGQFLTNGERETFSRLLINALKKNR